MADNLHGRKDLDLCMITRDAMVEALRRCGGCRKQAIYLLGCPRSTFYRKMRSFDIKQSDWMRCV